MGAKKKSEKLVELIQINDQQLLQECENLEDNSSIVCFIHATDSCVQLKALKQCLQDVNKCTGSPRDNAPEATVIRILVAAMIQAHPRNQSRKAISSALQTVKAELHMTVKEAIRSQLLQIMNAAHDINSFRSVIDNITSLIDNFELGTCAVLSFFTVVISFISRALTDFYEASREADCDETASRNMHHCLTTIQLCNRLTQKVLQQYKQEDYDSTERKHVFENEAHVCLESLCCIMWKILSSAFLLDCQTTCGMGVPLILKALYGASWVPQVLHLADLVEKSLFLQYLTECGIHGRLVTRNLSVSSQFCILGGMLAMFDIQELMIDTKNGCLLTNVIGCNVIQLIHCGNDSNTKLMASRTLVLLTSKICECLQSAQVTKGVTQALIGQQSLLDQITTYVWNHWQDPVDTIRYQTKLIFQNVIGAHLLATGEDPKTSLFIMHMAESLLALNWQTKGRYEPLCVIVQYTGAQRLLDLSPQLPAELMLAMGEQILAPYVSQLYEKLYLNHRETFDTEKGSFDPPVCSQSDVSKSAELKQQKDIDISKRQNPDDSMQISPGACSHSDIIGSVINKDQSSPRRSDWLRIWVNPVLVTLCKGSNIQKKFVIEYIIPDLLKKYPDTFMYIVEQLSCDTNTYGDKSRSLGALVTCLTQAKRFGVLDTLQGAAAGWRSLVGQEIIVLALCDSHDQVRLDTFGLLCESRKTTEVLKSEDLDLIKLFLTFNLDSQSPGFRQHLTALVKKLVLRLRDGGKALNRTLNTAKSGTDTTSAESTLQYYKVFLQWFCDHLFDQLHPFASFPRRTTAVSLLGIIVQVFNCKENRGGQSREFHILDVVTPGRVHTLMELLTDTFEQNKLEAFNILSALPVGHLYLKDHVMLHDLIESSLELAYSTRPQDCTTAAHIFRLLLKIPDTAAILCNIRNKVKPTNSCENFASASHQMAWLLLSELEDELLVAEKSLIHAAATRPLYPVLHCLRYLLADINLKQESGSAEWQKIISNVIKTCFKVASIVSPVVSNSSPEGNIPAETLHALGPGLRLDAVVQSERDQQLLLSASDSAAKVTHMPEYLVVCCWRSIKEVSLLLGQLTQRAPLVALEQSGQGHIEISELHAIGEYFIKQLTESRHRGAFELAYTGFVKMAHMLWRCPLPEVHKLPLQWLDDILRAVSDTDPSDKLCATRRSAGVPFYIRALVSTEPSTRGRQCFKQVMTRLLALAWPEQDQEADRENIPQVHALNILRALYQETALGDDVFPYIAEGLQVALLGYSAKLWSLRNSSTLLFSALMTRIFGVKRTKNELSKKNCMTGRVFFHRFPSLHRFLLQELKEATSDLGVTTQGESTRTTLHPNLYPILLVLGRLYPSVIEGADAAYDLKAFVEPVISCAHSPVYKIRIMAARALCPLVAKGDTTETLMMLVGRLPRNPHKISHNATHGLLLQIEHLLDNVMELPVDVQSNTVSLILERLIDCKWLLSSSNPSFLTRTAFLNVLCKLSAVSCQPLLRRTGTLTPGCVWRSFKDALSAALSGDIAVNIHVPGAVNFYALAARHLCEAVTTVEGECDRMESVFWRMLTCELYEVRLQALGVLSACHRQSSGDDDDDDDDGGEDDDDDLMLQEDDGKDNFASNSSTNTDVIITQKAAEIMQGSNDLFKELVTMVMEKETYPGCLVKVIEALCIHKRTRSFPWNTGGSSYTEEQVLERIFNTFMLHNRDEVRCAAVKLTAFIIPHLYKETTQEAESLMSKWIRLLDEGCCAECSINMRLAVATTLIHTASFVLYNIERKSFTLWMIILRLLHDEDGIVRQQMTKVVHHLKYISIPVDSDLYPPVVDKLVLQAMTAAYWSRECLDCLLSCLWHDIEPDSFDKESDIRLFDKGEMNTYRDQVQFMNIIAEHLTAITTGSQVTSKLYLADLYKKLTPLVEISLPLSLDGSTVQLLETRLDEALAELHEVTDQLPEMTLKLSLTKQNLYRDTIIKLWRLCTILQVISRMIAVSESQNIKLRQHLASLKKKFKFQCMLTEMLLQDNV